MHRGAGITAAAMVKPSQADELRLSTKLEPILNPNARRNCSNSTVKDDLAPAQLRRRAQNRAA
jgi:hypothetical protein